MTNGTDLGIFKMIDFFYEMHMLPYNGIVFVSSGIKIQTKDKTLRLKKPQQVSNKHKLQQKRR